MVAEHLLPEHSGSAGGDAGALFALEDAEIQTAAASWQRFYSLPCLTTGVFSFSSAVK